MKYSVLLLYPDYMNDDGTETYFAHVEADDVADAVKAAQIGAADANNCAPETADDFAELITFPGHIEPCPLVEVDKGAMTYEAAAAAQAGARLPGGELRPDLKQISETANDAAPRDPADLAQEIAADRSALIAAAHDVIDLWATSRLAEAVNALREAVELAEQTDHAADKCECDNCGHICRGDELDMIRDIEQRLDPNGPTPAGECPECGALSYLIKAPDPLEQTDAAAMQAALASIGDACAAILSSKLDVLAGVEKILSLAAPHIPLKLSPLRQDLQRIANTANDREES